MSEWDVGLFGCGSCSLCCYSYLYYGYAIAEAKAMMDGSDVMYNVNCVNPCVARW